MKKVFKRVLYIILGYIFFVFIYCFTQVIIVNLLGFRISFLQTLIESILTCLFIYLLLCFTYTFILYLYSIIIANKLNKKLEKLKNGGKKDEK